MEQIMNYVKPELVVFANTSIGNSQEIALATFTSIVQGILVAGLSTYADQIMKQIGKED